MQHSFHVVVPSLPGSAKRKLQRSRLFLTKSFRRLVTLPGYGWSEAPTAPGYDIHKVANLMVSLMEALGYKQYVAQGGDWGHLVAAHMAIIDSQRCLAIHLNMVRLLFRPACSSRVVMTAASSNRWPWSPATWSSRLRWPLTPSSRGGD